jgi:UDP-N-acetyl-2-amino-2-deoxyglucuronate dehydrogenase
MKNFVLTGVGGYIAPRHLRAIKETGGNVLAVLDPSDSVGIIDSYFPEASFFTEFERFDRHIEKLRRNKNKKIDYVSICSPNYLHDAHIRFALRIDADAICEKPVVLNPWNLDALSVIQNESRRNVNVILQLRLHPSIIKLKKEVENSDKDKVFDVDLTYITPRGKWYFSSWKGDVEKSGGIGTNIGVHFFDMLSWIFGEPGKSIVHFSSQDRISGFTELKRARVRWFLSLNSNDLSFIKSGDDKTYRSIVVNKNEIEFSDGFTHLHTLSYENILKREGFTLEDARSSIEIVSNIRNMPSMGKVGNYHPLLKKIQ